MKHSLPHYILVHGLKHIAALVGCLAFPLASSAQAVVGYSANSTYLNVYFNDGSGSSSAYGPTASPYTPTLETTTSGSTGIGMPLTSYGLGSWLQTGSPNPPNYPLGPQSANWSGFWSSIGYAFAAVQYDQGTFFMGSNTVSSTYVAPYGTSLYLQNTAGSGTAELRLDWTTTYTYNGPPLWQNSTAYTVGEQVTDINGNAELCVAQGTSSLSGSTPPGGWPNNPNSLASTTDAGVTWMIIPTFAPAEFMLTAGATVNNTGNSFFAVTGQETFTVNGVTSTTLQIPWGGDFLNGYSTLPSALQGHIDSGIAGVFGSKTAGTYTGMGISVVASGTLPMLIHNNDTLTVNGYIDVFVDPADFQIEIEPVPQQTLGITTSGNKPVVYFPMITPSNLSLQTTTNLLTGPWVPVTNGVPTAVSEGGELYGGLMITNAAKSAFFRLH